jgi:hypothetical protein
MKNMKIQIIFFKFLTSLVPVIYLSLSEIPIWTHQRQFGLITVVIDTGDN